MATHSSILAWRSPWTEGPGGLTVRGGSQELDTTDTARSSTAASNLVTTIRIYSGLPCIYYSFTHILTEFSKQPMNQVLLLSSLYRRGVWGPEDGSH